MAQQPKPTQKHTHSVVVKSRITTQKHGKVIFKFFAGTSCSILFPTPLLVCPILHLLRLRDRQTSSRSEGKATKNNQILWHIFY